jgi:hypothetical protein
VERRRGSDEPGVFSRSRPTGPDQASVGSGQGAGNLRSDLEPLDLVIDRAIFPADDGADCEPRWAPTRRRRRCRPLALDLEHRFLRSSAPIPRILGCRIDAWPLSGRREEPEASAQSFLLRDSGGCGAGVAGGLAWFHPVRARLRPKRSNSTLSRRALGTRCSSFVTTHVQRCGACNGSGRIEHHDQNTGRTTMIVCPTCNGTGKAPDRAGE